jgi:hypothetical protein
MRTAFFTTLGAVLMLLLAPAAGSAGSIEGRWTSNLGETTFTQDGSAVRGELVFLNGQKAKLTGVFMGSDLHFSYVHDNGVMGTGKVTLSADESQLRGQYTDARGAQQEWILVRAGGGAAPAVADVSGQWNSNLGSVVFEQQGANITGTVTFANGQKAAVSGQLDGARFRFNYQHDNGQRGAGELTLAENHRQMSGAFRDAMGRSFEWTLARPSQQQAPDIAGQWNSNIGSVVFQQNNRDVTGALTFANGQTASIQGRLTGGNLDFSFRHVNGMTGSGRIGLAANGQEMSGSYVTNQTGQRATWTLRR